MTIVGVAAAGFDGMGPMRTHLWLPLSAWTHVIQPATSGPKAPYLSPFVRLASGTSDQQAQAELSMLSQRFRTTERRTYADRTPDDRSVRADDANAASAGGVVNRGDRSCRDG